MKPYIYEHQKGVTSTEELPFYFGNNECTDKLNYNFAVLKILLGRLKEALFISVTSRKIQLHKLKFIFKKLRSVICGAQIFL